MGRYLCRDADFIARIGYRYRKLKRVEAVILGCTELSVLVERVKGPRDISQIDPLKLLASRLIDKGTST